MPDPLPPRDLILCCDGTGNVWGNRRDTNVVELVRRVVQDERQIVYYDPGVGTVDGFPPVSPFEHLSFRLRLLAGLAFGGGVYENIAQAYRFLVLNWRPGDRIWLFGFSRGAFTARAVSGMVSLFGIVRPAGEVMIPTLLRVYFSDPRQKDRRGLVRAQTAQDIRRHFADAAGAQARVHFIGVWDTVETVGLLTRRHITSGKDVADKRFDHVRHAVSADENRRKYAPRLYEGEPRDAPGRVRRTGADGRTGEVELPSFKQLWFPGVHSDVGGGYTRRGLSDLALQWMLDEAQAQGLRLAAAAAGAGCAGGFGPAGAPAAPEARHAGGTTDPAGAAPAAGEAGLLDRPLRPDPLACAHDQPLTRAFGPWWALTGLQRRPPPPSGLAHPALGQRPPHGGPQLWTPPWRHVAVRTPAVAAVLSLLTLLALTAWVDPAARTSAVDLARWQVLAPWLAEAHAAAYRGRLAPLLLVDALLIAAYTQLLCAGCAFTVRRLAGWRPHDTAAHHGLALALLGLLWAAPLADLAENALTVAVAAQPDSWLALPLALAAGLKWGALAGLAALFTWGAVQGRSPQACTADADRGSGGD